MPVEPLPDSAASTTVRYAPSPLPESAPAVPRRSLLEGVLEATAWEATRPGSPPGAAPGLLEGLLRASSDGAALRRYLDWCFGPEAQPGRRDVIEALGHDIARLDALLSAQVNAILHQPKFQRLEASWRGLRYLVEQTDKGAGVLVRLLNVSWKELALDLDRAIEFDQSQLFRKIYTDEFDMPNGEPFGVLLGDYEIWPHPSAEHPVDDIAALEKMSHVAAAAFAPFIVGAHPTMFALEDFSGLERQTNLPKHFNQPEYIKWRAFRESDDARFVGLTVPRVLMRVPYDDDGTRCDGFFFREETAGPDRGKYLWGNAVYAFGGVLARSFARNGWLAEIRGAQRAREGGGIVPGLPVHCFSTDRTGIAAKCSTDVIITDFQEQELGELGFVPMCFAPDTELSVFYTNHSAQKPKAYNDPAVTMNARISAFLQYTLCVSRFAHYLKSIGRDMIGSFAEAEQIERALYDWLHKYVTSDAEASPEVKAQYPLREAEVKVREQPGRPGHYQIVAHLWPHFQLEELVAAVRIATELHTRT